MAGAALVGIDGPLAHVSYQVDVSFHGGISVQPNITTTPPAKPYLTFQSGGADESPVGLTAGRGACCATLLNFPPT